MSHHTEYRFCQFAKEKVPFCVQARITNDKQVLSWHSCMKASECNNPSCVWKSQENKKSLKDYTLIY